MCVFSFFFVHCTLLDVTYIWATAWLDIASSIIDNKKQTI